MPFTIRAHIYMSWLASSSKIKTLISCEFFFCVHKFSLLSSQFHIYKFPNIYLAEIRPRTVAFVTTVVKLVKEPANKNASFVF